jgi:hypothetical protein
LISKYDEEPPISGRDKHFFGLWTACNFAVKFIPFLKSNRMDTANAQTKYKCVDQPICDSRFHVPVNMASCVFVSSKWENNLLNSSCLFRREEPMGNDIETSGLLWLAAFFHCFK